MQTDFFEKLSKAMADGMTVNITVAKKGEKLNVIFMPVPRNKEVKDITPFTVKGTADEIDATYNNIMLVGTAHISGLESNAAEFLKAAGAENTGMKDMFQEPVTEKKKPGKQAKSKPEPVKQESAPKSAPEPEKPVLNPNQVTTDPVIKVNEPNTNFENEGSAGEAVNVGEQVNQANVKQLETTAQAATIEPVQAAKLPQQEETAAPVQQAPAPIIVVNQQQSPSEEW